MGSKNLRLAELASNVSAAGEYTEAAGVVVYNTVDSLPTLGNAAGDVAFIDSSNLLYIYSGEGWYNIGLVNQSPTITSGGAGSYTLATDGTPTVITLIGSDPDGFPITWGFTTSGLDSEATVVQGTGDSANVFTITPSTDTAKAGTFTVTFRASDGINIATDVNEFTLSFGDANFNDTIALMQTDKDSFIRDGGANSLRTTVTGDPKPSSFSPYRGSYYSAAFDGTGDYLSATLSSSIGTSTDFTIEGWVYNSGATGNKGIFHLATTVFPGSVTGLALAYFDDLSTVKLYYNNGTQGNVGSALLAHKWYHFAISRSSGTAKLFIDGVERTSWSDTTAYGDSLAIGGYYSSSYVLQGYISNFRVLVGTGLYASDFTPSTTPLTAITNTALLTCQSNRFLDNSSNDLTISSFGDAAVSGHVPFAFDTSDTTGSIYYDGNDYVSYGDGSATAPWNPNGDGDHTWEAWIYPITTAGGGTQIFMSTTWTSPGGNFYIENAGNLRWQIYTQNSADTSNRVPAKQWSHVAWCESSGTGYLFLNGELIESTAGVTNALGYSNYFYSGARGGTSPFTGYISNMKTHRAALYTSAFTPPTSPLTATGDTSLLTHQTYYPHNNISVGDKSGGDMPLTVNGDTNVTSFTPYSPKGHSVYFDGSGDYLSVPNDAGFQFGTGDFTVECWINKPAAANGSVVDVRTGTLAVPWAFYVDGSNFPYFYDGTIYTSTVSIVNNAWNHIAVTRSSGVLKIFVNGVQGYSASHTVSLNAAGSLLVGGVAAYATGYISNLRIVKGTALYTSNFTPSTSALTPTAATSLLTCQSPSFIDNSPHRHTLTRYGDARSTPFSPFAGNTITPNTYSMIMNAHTDIATVESNTFDMSGEFTLEAWVFPTNTPSQNWGIFDARSSGGTNAYWIWYLKNVSGSLYVEMFAASGAGNVIRGATAINLYEWTHVALTRNSSNGMTVWVNGASDATATVSTNFTVSSSSAQIGSTKDAGDGTYESNGCISNLRLVTGSCLYTTTFTPSTTALTAVSGTQLLTCQDSTLKDNSSNNLAITTSTTTAARPSEFNPFGYTTTSQVEYSPVTHGGSMYGDGTTDYVDVPAANWNSVGTGDFCIQFWTYTKEVDANKGQIAVGGNKIAIRFDTSNRMTFWVAGNGGPTSTPNNTVYPFNWYHVCLERSGSTNTLYINGVAQASNTTTPSNDTSPIIRIGGQYANNTGYTFTGWISDLRIQSKAVYKANFLPPKQVEYGADTKLQVPFGDAAVYDVTGNLMFDINTLTVATDVTKFHNQSLKFAGVNDFVDTTERHGTTKVYGEQLKLGTGDYTIEFWWNFASTSGRQDLLWIGSTSTRLGILWNLNAGQLTYYPATDAISATVSFSTDTWYHIAVARSSGYTKMFVDGTQVGSTYTDSKNFDGDILYLGKDSGANSSYSNGYMDGLRITKGTARYTSNFTAPTDAFPKK